MSSPGLLEARNAIPSSSDTGYRPLNTLNTTIPAFEVESVKQPILGHTWMQDSDLVVHNFAGTASALLRLSGSSLTWVDVSQSGGYTAVTGWSFARFGDRIIAVCPEEVPQYFDADSTEFDDLPGSPPTAKHIAVVRDFVVLGDLENFPYRVQWSGFFNSEIWTVGDMQNQSDFQDFYGEGGRIQKIVGGEYGLIFQEHSIRLMEYEGPPNVFRFSEIQQARGTPAPGSVVRAGAMTFFYSWDGFCVIMDRQIKNIGTAKINNWFRDRTSAASLKTGMTATIDRRRRLVMWSYAANGSDTNNEILIYNWASDRWSYASEGATFLGEWSAPGYTLEDLDTLVGTDIDAMTVSLDSDLYKGGDVGVVAFSSDGDGQLFDGEPGTCEFVTGDLAPAGGGRVFVTGLRPIIEDQAGNAAILGAVQARGLTTQNTNQSALLAPDAHGEVPLRVDTRFMRAVLRITGNFRMAQMIELLLRQSGKR